MSKQNALDVTELESIVNINFFSILDVDPEHIICGSDECKLLCIIEDDIVWLSSNLILKVVDVAQLLIHETVFHDSLCVSEDDELFWVELIKVKVNGEASEVIWQVAFFLQDELWLLVQGSFHLIDMQLVQLFNAFD